MHFGFESEGRMLDNSEELVSTMIGVIYLGPLIRSHKMPPLLRGLISKKGTQGCPWVPKCAKGCLEGYLHCGLTV